MINLSLSVQTLQRLEKLIGKSCFDFLGYTLNLRNSMIIDNLEQSIGNPSQQKLQVLKILLDHYSLAKPIELTGKLVKFKDIPGGYAYDNAFTQRAIQPISKTFGKKPIELVKVAELLCGKQLRIGDASVKVPALQNIPLTYVLWAADEFEASANIFFDESTSSYLPTEDIAVLGEITTVRIIEAKDKLNLQ